MKIVYFIFLSFFLAQGQQNDSLPVLEYEVHYQLGKPLFKKGYVFEYDNAVHYYTSESVFLEKITKFYVDEETSIPNINVMAAGKGINHHITFLKDNVHLSLYPLGNQLLTAKEDLPLQQWQATGEEKIVNGRNCIELFTSFRGRDYIAYVDLSVPINFGPWKFNNFPGLPVLINDTENKLSWTLSKVGYENVETLDKFTDEQEEYLNSLKAVSLREYVKLYDSTKGGFDITFSRLPREYKPENPGSTFQRGGLELKFEWEEN